MSEKAVRKTNFFFKGICLLRFVSNQFCGCFQQVHIIMAGTATDARISIPDINYWPI